jgi:hypothetical protein
VNTADLKEFVALEKEKAQLNGRLKVINQRLEVLDGAITEDFVKDGIQSMRVDGRTVYLHRDIYASPKDGERAAVVEALKECDLSQYIKEDYNANSLTAFVREMVREAEEQARLEKRVLVDPAGALPAGLAAKLNVSTVFSVSSRS